MNQPLAAFLVPPRFGAPNRIVYEIGLVQTSVFIKWVSIQKIFTGSAASFNWFHKPYLVSNLVYSQTSTRLTLACSFDRQTTVSLAPI